MQPSPEGRSRYSALHLLRPSRALVVVRPTGGVVRVQPTGTPRFVGLVLQLRRGGRVVAVDRLEQGAVFEDLAVVVPRRLVSGPLDALVRVLLELLRVHAHRLTGGLFSIDL